jgi:hypothetical protein
MNSTDPTKYRVGEQHRPHQIQGGGTTQTPPNTGRVNNTDPTKYRKHHATINVIVKSNWIKAHDKSILSL